MTADLPLYHQLPTAADGGRSAWGVFGAADELGTLNLIDAAAVKASTQAVRAGRVFALNAPLDFFEPPLDTAREPLSRRTIQGDMGGFADVDDAIDSFYPQVSSQWDALGHVAYAGEHFYNGATLREVLDGRRNSIAAWAARGIVGRGVVIDVARFCAGRWRGGAVGAGAVTFGVDDLEAARQAAGIEYSQGCILLLHTGFLSWYAEQDRVAREILPHHLTSPGIDHTEEMAAYLWDNRIGAIAADNFAVEVWPADLGRSAQPFGFLHRILIGQLGMALGELWDLRALAADCSRDDVYECMVASAPLHIAGGVGSPANALAIK